MFLLFWQRALLPDSPMSRTLSYSTAQRCTVLKILQFFFWLQKIPSRDIYLVSIKPNVICIVRARQKTSERTFLLYIARNHPAFPPFHFCLALSLRLHYTTLPPTHYLIYSMGAYDALAQETTNVKISHSHDINLRLSIPKTLEESRVLQLLGISLSFWLFASAVNSFRGEKGDKK